VFIAKALQEAVVPSLEEQPVPRHSLSAGAHQRLFKRHVCAALPRRKAARAAQERVDRRLPVFARFARAYRRCGV